MAFETVAWAKNAKEDFRSWFFNELHNTLGDRSQLERKWLDLLTQHRARVLGDGTSDVPFIGASDVEYPMTSMHSDPVYSDLMQTLHIPQNFFTVSPLRADMVDVAKPFEKFLGMVERNTIKMRKVNEKAFIDLIVLGTCVYKNYILHSSRMVQEYGDGDKIIETRKIRFEPRVEHVPLKDFFIPAYASCIDPDAVGGAPWVAHRFELTWGQFQNRADESAPFLPRYDPAAVKKVQAYLESRYTDLMKDQVQRDDEYSPWLDEKIILHEVWARYDSNGDGFDEDLVIIWHHDSQTICRATHIPLMHGERPFHSATYMPHIGFYGIGLGEQDEWAQLSMTRLFNNAVNNVMLANQRMLTVPLGANFSPDEPFYAGKIWPLPPGEEIQSIQMGEVYPSIFQMMSQLGQMSEGRTGVSELRQGSLDSMPSRTPASTVLSVLQEGNKKFDMILSNLRTDALAYIGVQIVQNLIQISRSDPRWRVLASQALGERDGQLVAKILNGPVHDVASKLGITVTATSSQVNKEVEKQSFVALMQIAAQVYPQMMQYAQVSAQMGGDQMKIVATADAAYDGLKELLVRLLENFDIRNPDPFLPGDESASAAPDPLQALLQGGGTGAMQPPMTQLGGPAGAGPFAQGAPQLAQVLGQR